MLRIAHVSDPHVLSPFAAEWRRTFVNKRLVGYANVLLRRARMYRRDYLAAVLTAAARCADHVVVTGDITNLGHESEYAQARALLDEVARSAEVTVVPGNHDLYLPEVGHDRRFMRHLGPFLRGDLPELATDVPAGPFPCVKLRGSVAFVALSTAVPRPPLVSSGWLGGVQLEAVRAVLAHPEVACRTPVILLHHDPVDSRLRLEQLCSGLVDARAFRHALDGLARGLVLSGHLHMRLRRQLTTRVGTLDLLCASGASLDHDDDRVRAGFNLYTLDGGTLATAEAWVVDPGSLAVVRRGAEGWG